MELSDPLSKTGCGTSINSWEQTLFCLLVTPPTAIFKLFRGGMLIKSGPHNHVIKSMSIDLSIRIRSHCQPSLTILLVTSNDKHGLLRPVLTQIFMGVIRMDDTNPL